MIHLSSADPLVSEQWLGGVRCGNRFNDAILGDKSDPSDRAKILHLDSPWTNYSRSEPSVCCMAG